MRSSATRGTGQLRLNAGVLASAIVVVGRACAFRRYHRSAQRIFRRALHGKRRAVVGFLDALQNQSADALRRLVRGFARKWEAAVRIVFLKSSAQLEAAGRNLSKAAPLAGSYFKNFGDCLLRRAIPFAPHGARVLILTLVSSLFEVCHGHQDTV